MTIALGSPELVSNIVSVDNAPIDAILSTDFGSYVRGMKKIEASQVSRQSDADKILREVEPVSRHTTCEHVGTALTIGTVSPNSAIFAWKLA